MRHSSDILGQNNFSRLIHFYFGVLLLLLVGIITPAKAGDDSIDAPVPRGTQLTFLEAKSGLASQFVSLPPWAEKVTLPSLPAQLHPFGKKPKEASTIPLVTTPGTTTPPASPSIGVKSTPMEAPPLVAVSPFLQWVQKNPQAVTEARKQASDYVAPTAPPAPAPGAAQDQPFWLPPASLSTRTDADTGGSAAIYQTPQR